MSKVINLKDYFSENTTHNRANRILEERQESLTLETQDLTTLKHRIKALQIENDTLLKVLEMDNMDALQAVLSKAINHENTQEMASQSAYWEREYSQLKDKIRALEALLTEKDKTITLLTQQNEQLLNELLAK